MSSSSRRDNSTARLFDDLKQALRERFDKRYRLGKRVSWQVFFSEWCRELSTQPPTQPSVRSALYSDNRCFCEYRIINGLCQLLLSCSYDEWSDQRQLFSGFPLQAEVSEFSSTPADLPEFSRQPPYHNLLAPEHTAFVGRHLEINRLLELLCWENPVRRLGAIGIGGIGKTTLVLEAAYRCLAASSGGEISPSAPSFDAIIFTSAQPQRLTGCGILRRLKRESTLRDKHFHKIICTF